MFSGLFDKSAGPAPTASYSTGFDKQVANVTAGAYSGSTRPGLVAEPAQVMVLVPGGRAEAAESALRRLKSYITGFGVILGLIGIAIVWWKRRSAVPTGLEGARALPGIDVGPVTLPGIMKVGPQHGLETERLALATPSSLVPPPSRHSRPPPVASPPPRPTPSSLLTEVAEDDIVPVIGQLPIWSNPEEPPEDQETRVSDNDPNIVAMIKAREAMSEAFESSMAAGLKAAPPSE